METEIDNWNMSNNFFVVLEYDTQAVVYDENRDRDSVLVP